MRLSNLFKIFFFTSLFLTVIVGSNQHITTETDETKQFHDLSGAHATHVEGHGNPNDLPENKHYAQFQEEWETKMFDYEADFVYMIQVDYKKKEIFYETIDKIPSRFRGAILVDDDDTQGIEIRIFSPSGVLVYQNATTHDIFEFSPKELGEYKIIFDNKYVNHNLRLTFTLSTAQNEVVKKEHMTLVEEKVQGLENFMNHNELNHKMKSSVVYQRMQKLNKTNSYFYTFSIIETLILAIISLWQLSYMKKLIRVE